jgi:hypothetical protein
VFAGIYVGAWIDGHVAVAAGIGGLGCAAAGAGCIAAVHGALGLGGTLSADGNPTNELQALADTSPKISQAMRSIEDWLGGGKLTAIRNQAGDFILRNAANTRRFRFDALDTYPHESPHMHLEYLGEIGKWIKSGPIFPGGQ